jgi:MFS family permease
MPEMRLLEKQDAAINPCSGSSPSWRSWIGLCAASFFLAEMGGVTMPFVNTYLVECGWGYDSVGAAVALAGFVSLLTNAPGGLLIDWTRRRRLLLASASLMVGFCFTLLPLVCGSQAAVFALLAAAGLAQPLFGPLTNAFTLFLVGHSDLNRALGIKEGWNHAGNIAAAVLAMLLVGYFSVVAVFLMIGVVSLFAAASGLLIRPEELKGNRGTVSTKVDEARCRFADVLRDPIVLILLASSVLFHFANAPVMPLVAQKIRHVGGSNTLVASTVLIAQSVMIPVALLAGWLGERWGRKPVLAIGFVVLPVRIALYACTDDPYLLVVLQSLDGIGAGIFGVTAVAVCGDLTRGRGHFNGLAGVLGTAVGIGGVAGNLLSGLIVQNYGFSPAFFTFSGIAIAAAFLLIGWLPETRFTRSETIVERESPAYSGSAPPMSII